MPGENLPAYVAMDTVSKGDQQAPQQQVGSNVPQMQQAPAYFQQPAGFAQQPGGYGQPTIAGYDQTAPPSYPGHPPQVHAQFQQSPGVVQPQSITIVTNSTVQCRPANYLWASILSCLCCNFVLGIIAIIFSTMSSSEADVGNFDKARSYGRVALGLSVGSLVLGIVVIIIGIVYYVVILQAVTSDCDYYLGSDTYC